MVTGTSVARERGYEIDRLGVAQSSDVEWHAAEGSVGQRQKEKQEVG